MKNEDATNTVSWLSAMSTAPKRESIILLYF